MEISKQNLESFFKLLTKLSKYSDNVAIIDGVTTIPITDGCLVLDMDTNTFGLNDFSCMDLKTHLKNIRPFLKNIVEDTCSIEDNGEYVLFNINGLEYPIEKREISHYTTNEIDLIRELPLVGNIQIPTAKAIQFFALLKTNKDNIESLKLYFDENWKLLRIQLDRISSEISINISINSSSSEKYVLSSHNFFDSILDAPKTDFMEFDVYNYRVDDDGDISAVMLLHKSDEQLGYQEFRCSDINDDFSSQLF